MVSVLFVRQLVKVTYKPSVYAPRETCCPVCEFCKLPPGKVLVNGTDGEIRSCVCLQCGHTFKAIGTLSGETPDSIEPTPVNSDNEIKKTKRGRKSGKSAGTNRRSGLLEGSS